MKVALVGVGTAGCRIAAAIAEQGRRAKREFAEGNVLLVDTDADGLKALKGLPRKRRFHLGETDDRVEDGGVGGDPELAVSVMREDLHDFRRALDDVEPYDLDAFLLVAALGGATGVGAGAVIVEELQATYEQPVYVLGVLPGADEGAGRSLTAARGIRTLVPAADNLLLFDNEAWRSMVDQEADDDEARYAPLNHEFASRVTALFGAGELASAPSGEAAIDVTDMIRALEPGGVSTIGHADVELPGYGGGLFTRLFRLFGRNSHDGPPDPTVTAGLVRKAATSALTLPCELDSTERALVVVTGPPSAISRRGFERARQWVEDETGTVEVFVGDEPNPRDSALSAVVLLSNVTTVPRIEAVQRTAIAHHRQLELTAPSADAGAPEPS